MLNEIKEALKKANDKYGDYTEARNALAIIAQAAEKYENTQSLCGNRRE